jgi:predicted ATPase
VITAVELTDFKNFRRARLELGPFTVLVGTNASGKSNLRDAFRFLHGVGRGYNLAEIIGQKWGDEGVLLWRGIRGGVREAAFHGQERFCLTAEMRFARPVRDVPRQYRYAYQIEVATPRPDRPPRVVSESLHSGPSRVMLFETSKPQDEHNVKVRLHRGRQPGRYPPSKSYVNSAPVLSQIAEDAAGKNAAVRTAARHVLEELVSFRFLDLSPEGMRIPSLSGQTVLGDRGENLSSVLHAICADEARKATLVEWVKELTPMDAKDFSFPSDQAGRILLTLVEEGGRQTSAYSASDGTLRFLAMIAALLGPEPARHYFFEELDNGIHPTRLALLLQLIESRVAGGKVQLITTTHSPQLLGLLSQESLRNAALTYRLPGDVTARVKRVVEIPEAVEIIKRQGLSRLHASGWLEDAVAFTESEETAE